MLAKDSRNMHRISIIHQSTATWSLRFFACLLLMGSTGCLALNIPSVRYDDPSDRGGLLGPHRPTDPHAALHADPHAAMNAESCDPAACHASGDGLGDESFEGEQPPPPPEVPWPRFHPLPTRPVFSSSL
jgi:hypothetical protein